MADHSKPNIKDSELFSPSKLNNTSSVNSTFVQEMYGKIPYISEDSEQESDMNQDTQIGQQNNPPSESDAQTIGNKPMSVKQHILDYPGQDDRNQVKQSHYHERVKKPLHGYRAKHPSHFGRGDRYDYEHVYEDDAMYEELKPHARAWKVYNDEMDNLEIDWVEDWKDGLDALLVLGALFSAVLTTFVVETYKKLDSDWGKISAALLAESVALQRAAMNGASAMEVPSSPLTPSSKFQAKSFDIILNAFWFTSLVLSLGTALSAVVAKQWIHQYIAVPTGTPQERARIRHFRFMGLEKWHMSQIIGLLPMMIHLSLGFFLIGLLFFLHELSLAIAIIVDILTSIIFLLYLASNLLPICNCKCTSIFILLHYFKFIIRAAKIDR
ncbi:hypothetical protein D9757_013824 [Collybiopsis confluens]|uniref:DUF6535 domain-containing protein n=1 Tax=Collybiopsis confluens TaxID=2823264 RepID=A0A8H5CSZ8_9AGAR|nr:hypothetical protein D9757_013824 [Collybiopsis confluens]